MSEPSKNANNLFLAVLTIVVLYVVYLVLQPLLKTIFLAAFLAILCQSLFSRLTRLMKGRRSPAAAVSCLVVTVILLLPVATLLALLTVESLSLYQQLSGFVQEGGVQKMLDNPMLGSAEVYIGKYLSLLGGDKIELKTVVVKQLQALSGLFIATGRKMATNFATSAALLFVLIFALYYFLMDGRRLIGYLTEVSPLPETRTRKIMRRFEDVTHAAFLGTFGVALAQGILGGIGLTIVGYQGIFWGSLMVLFSLIPVVGSAVIWFPAVVLLFLSGRPGAGFFLLAWSVGLVSTVDNFLRPYLMGNRSGLHPLVILLSIIGGVARFGMLGIVFGPLAAALGLTLLSMFGEEFGTRTSSASD